MTSLFLCLHFLKLSVNIHTSHQIISEQTDIEALIDGTLVPIHIQSNGLFVVDISGVTFTKGMHTLKVQSLPNDVSCESYILVFEEHKIVVDALDCKPLLSFLKEQSPEIIGIILGFITHAQQATSPCVCMKPLLDGLSLKKFGVMYGYSLKVLENEGTRKVKSCKDFNEDFMCLGIQREWLPPLYCQLMEILDFPKTKDICIQAECGINIDLSRIVSNHMDDFVYEVVSMDITGDVYIEGHCLFYTPPPQSMFSIYVLGYITYRAINSQGKSNEGTLTIKMV